eukprot:COSAG04_NODE_2956_length_3348_cov_7.203945_2_plen_441_part_00
MSSRPLSKSAKARAARAKLRAATLVIVPGVADGVAESGDALAAFVSETSGRAQQVTQRLAVERMQRAKAESQLRYERSACAAADQAVIEAERDKERQQQRAAAEIAAERHVSSELREKLAAEAAARRQGERDLAEWQERAAAIAAVEERAAAAEAALAESRAATEAASAAAAAARQELEQQAARLARRPEPESESEPEPEPEPEQVAQAAPAAAAPGQEEPSPPVAGEGDGVDERAADAAAVDSAGAEAGPACAQEGLPAEPKVGAAAGEETLADPDPEGDPPAEGGAAAAVAAGGATREPPEPQPPPATDGESGPGGTVSSTLRSARDAVSTSNASAAPAPPDSTAEQRRQNAMVADGLQSLLSTEGAARDALSLHGAAHGGAERWTKRAPYSTRPARKSAHEIAPLKSSDVALYKLGAEVRQLWKMFEQGNKPRRRVL